MTERQTSRKVTNFLNKDKPWLEEYKLLRAILLETELVEDFKWMHPCYTINDKNVVLIHAFKDYIALLFHKGSILKDEDKLLIQQTANVQAARQLRFTSFEEIESQKEIILKYVREAIETEKAGKEVEMKSEEVYQMPEEMVAYFSERPDVQEAFEKLTPGRQRQYMYTVAQAKRPATRTSRIEKYAPQILNGKGIND